jgi:CBS domain-containing protein
MALKYSKIEIFTNEEANFKGIPLYKAVVQYALGLKIAARCLVTRCMEGCYENGEIATQSVLIGSFNMPVVIQIVLPSVQADVIVPTLEEMVDEGIVTVSEIAVRCHKTRNHLFPRHLKVKDMMTPNPESVLLTTPVSDVVRLLLSSIFTGVPVVDEAGCPKGVISQGDLIYRGGMPARLGLLADSGAGNQDAVLESLALKKAGDIMSPAVCIEENQLLTKAVHLMLEKGLKRLPVTNETGKLTGILSRMDIFRTITHHSPDWAAFRSQDIPVGNLKYVSDIMRRDVHTVFQDTPVAEVLQMITANDIQRVAIVDKAGSLLGIISDRDLLAAFSDQKEGIWEYFTSKLPFGQRGKDHTFSRHLAVKTAAEVMTTDPPVILEDATIDEAIGLMTRKMLKRLPVMDHQGKFKGMISRESLLRTGFTNL